MHAHYHSPSSAVNIQRHSLTQTIVVKHELVIATDHFLLINSMISQMIQRRLMLSGIIISSGGGRQTFKGSTFEIEY